MVESEEGGSVVQPLLRRGDIIRNVIDGVTEQYRVLDFLGKGGFGECFAAESVRLRNYVAIKVVNKGRLKEGNQKKIFREIGIHRVAQHPNIVRMYDAFQDPNNFFMILELCKVNSLLNSINEEHAKKGRFDEQLGSRYVNQLCDAVVYLSKRSILHRDIKPGNCMVAHTGDIKLGDFGLATKMEDLCPGSVSGTPNYLAPEVIRKQGHSLASEVWSIGCLVYCMLVGKPPFEAENVDATYARIKNGYYSYPERPEVSPNAKALIRDCLDREADKRAVIYWMSDYAWLKNTRTSSGGYPLMRAKSTGNMVQRDINGNHTPVVPVSSRYLRPKSAMMSTSQAAADRSRRKSITGSHDSGFGSETDMLRSTNVAFCNIVEKVNQYISSLTEARAQKYVLVPSVMPPVAIAKWVDYSNRRGFGCILTDGTLTVKFNEGACLSWPASSDLVFYAQQPFASPRILDSSGPVSQTEREQLEVAREYCEYMERELQGLELQTDCSPKPFEDNIYIVHHHLDQKHVMVLFSNGLLQITLLETKVKLILWREDDQRYVGVAVLSKDHPPCAYRLAPVHCRESFCTDNSMTPIRPPPRVHDYFRETTALIQQDLLRLAHRPVQVTSC